MSSIRDSAEKTIKNSEIKKNKRKKIIIGNYWIKKITNDKKQQKKIKSNNFFLDCFQKYHQKDSN